MINTPVLHLLCGKIASGKSTLAAQLSAPEGTVLISEDAWLSALFGDQMKEPKDYARCTQRLRAVMGSHVVDVLREGLSVVLDFAANTPETRQWLRGIIDQSGADHCLHILEADDDLCLRRLRARNAAGVHAFSVTEEQFHLFTKHFSVPTATEGFNLVRHVQ